MRKFILLGSALTFFLAIFASYSFTNGPAVVEKETSVKWYTWEEAIELNKTNPKKIFIDVYTNWCGWCKKMDKATFESPKVAEYLKENFYPIKLNAEMKEDIVFNNHTFKYVASGRRGYHELAASLLNNRMSYPSCVAMDENINRITIIPGYREANDMMTILEFINEEKYKTMSFDEYAKSKK